MSLGLILGDLTYLTAVVLGLAFVAQTFGMVFLVIKWLGVAYLAFLAWTLLDQRHHAGERRGEEGQGRLVRQLPRRPDASRSATRRR